MRRPEIRLRRVSQARPRRKARLNQTRLALLCPPRGPASFRLNPSRSPPPPPNPPPPRQGPSAGQRSWGHAVSRGGRRRQLGQLRSHLGGRFSRRRRSLKQVG